MVHMIRSASRADWWKWLAIGFTGIVLRLRPWWFPIGGNDAVLWSLPGVFIGAVYWLFRVSSIPLQPTMTGHYPFSATIPGILAWMVLVHFIRIRLPVSRGTAA